MVYEGLLLFGVLFFTDLIFAIAFQQRHALYLAHQLQMVIFAVLGFYFIWQWTRGGQTLPMKTWRIRLVAKDGCPVSLRQASVRYLLAWMWFMPALVLNAALGWTKWMSVACVAAGFILWTLTIFLDKDRQFLHDRLAGTRLIVVPPATSSKASESSA